MNFHAAALFLQAALIAHAQPPMVVALPGAWPNSVGIGAMPISAPAWGQGAPEPGSQSPVYQLEPMAMASLPCFMSSGGWPTESDGKSCDAGAPKPSAYSSW